MRYGAYIKIGQKPDETTMECLQLLLEQILVNPYKTENGRPFDKIEIISNPSLCFDKPVQTADGRSLICGDGRWTLAVAIECSEGLELSSAFVIPEKRTEESKFAFGEAR